MREFWVFLEPIESIKAIVGVTLPLSLSLSLTFRPVRRRREGTQNHTNTRRRSASCTSAAGRAGALCACPSRGYAPTTPRLRKTREETRDTLSFCSQSLARFFANRRATKREETRTPLRRRGASARAKGRNAGGARDSRACPQRHPFQSPILSQRISLLKTATVTVRVRLKSSRDRPRLDHSPRPLCQSSNTEFLQSITVVGRWHAGP